MFPFSLVVITLQNGNHILQAGIPGCVMLLAECQSVFALHRYTGTRLEADLGTQEPKGTMNQTCTREKERPTQLQEDFCMPLLVSFKAVCYRFMLCWHSMVPSEPSQCHVGLSNIKICNVLMCSAERDPLLTQPADLDFSEALQGLSGLDSFM